MLIQPGVHYGLLIQLNILCIPSLNSSASDAVCIVIMLFITPLGGSRRANQAANSRIFLIGPTKPHTHIILPFLPFAHSVSSLHIQCILYYVLLLYFMCNLTCVYVIYIVVVYFFISWKW